MKSLTTAHTMLFLLVAAACGGSTVDLGGPPDGGGGSRSTGAAGDRPETSTSTTTSGPGTGAGGGTGTTTTGAAGDRPGTTTGTGGYPNTGGAGGRGGAGTGGSISDAGAIGCGARLGNTCPANMFCDFTPDAMCGFGDQPGTCQPKPQICTADCPGVCGCDGTFYCNACDAQRLGVDDNPSNTSCKPSPPDAGQQVCGGLAGLKCPANSYCKFPPAEICGHADGQGVCQPRPQVCPADCGMVCGCDGKIYCNACVAASAGVDVSPNPGSCPVPPNPGRD